jgi:sterol desaturase/sphingolipid hydroxylase (fatty acid hydroxylase superfamily)
MGFVLIGLLVVAAVARWLAPGVAISLFCGIAVHAWIGARLHVLYHLDRPAGPVLRWMRTFHDGHHIAPGNYGLVWPLFDILGGSYIPPRTVDALDAAELFHRFEPAESSTCGQPLIRRHE